MRKDCICEGHHKQDDLKFCDLMVIDQGEREDGSTTGRMGANSRPQLNSIPLTTTTSLPKHWVMTN